MSDIAFKGYYLENTLPGHSKFYTVLIGDDGTCVTAWGKIGSKGQHSVNKLPSREDAEAVGLRQVYSKAAKGYVEKVRDLGFAVDDATAKRATQGAQDLLLAFAQARRQPQYTGERDTVLTHYDQFVDKAQNLLNGASGRSFDEVYADFEELEKVWKEIDDKHAEAVVTVSLIQQTLQQRLMSGAL